MKSRRALIVLSAVVASVAALGTQRAMATTQPIDVSVWLSSGPTPNPVLTGANSIAGYAASADNSLIDEEALDAGPNWTWSPAGTSIWDSDHWASDSASLSVSGSGNAATATFSSGTAGLWLEVVEADCLYSDGNTNWVGSGTASASIKVQNVLATFSRAARPGVTTGATSRADQITITINGAAGAKVDLQLQAFHTDIHATVSPTSVTIPPGQTTATQTLTIDGTSASDWDPDNDLLALDDTTSDQVGDTTVTVTIPANWTDNASPALSGNWVNPAGNTFNWETDVTFTVKDQFAVALGSVWAGALMQESLDPPNAQGWVGFWPANPTGEPLSGGAQAVDPSRRGATFNAGDAAAIRGGTFNLGTQAAPQSTVMLKYEVLDGTTAYPLTGDNTRTHWWTNSQYKTLDTHQ